MPRGALPVGKSLAWVWVRGGLVLRRRLPVNLAGESAVEGTWTFTASGNTISHGEPETSHFLPWVMFAGLRFAGIPVVHRRIRSGCRYGSGFRVELTPSSPRHREILTACDGMPLLPHPAYGGRRTRPPRRHCDSFILCRADDASKSIFLWPRREDCHGGRSSGAALVRADPVGCN